MAEETAVWYCTACGERFIAWRNHCLSVCSPECASVRDAVMFAYVDATFQAAVPKALDVLGFSSIEEYEEAKAARDDPQGFVYFIQAGDGPVKIGFSTNVEKRMVALQISSPHELALIAKMSGNKALEKQIHERFSRLALRGEWFEMDGELEELIKTGNMPE